MAKPRIFKGIRSKGNGSPAIRVAFTGKDQLAFYDLLKIAENDFDLTQTALARLVLMDWVKNFEMKRKESREKAVQIVLDLEAANSKAITKKVRVG